MIVGTHRLERLLGRGGMGAVFLAYDSRLHRHVALKVLDHDAADATASARLLREARNAAALNHPHICTIHEVGEADGTAFIAMEFVEGRSLRERVDEGALSMSETVRLGIQAADALAYAHQHGVVHRDFKAANAIVGENGRLKVVDFGLARRDDPPLSDATTMASMVPSGAVAGTPYAMAPEQVRGEAADARTDVWALGVLLYELATAGRPFNGPSVPELYSSILTTPPVPLPPTVPGRLTTVITRCLEKDPARRYQRAEEVRAALEAIATGATAHWSTWSYRLRRRPALAAIAAVVAAVAVPVGINLAGLRDELAGVLREEPPIRLAVLPFENLTGDPEQEYFSDGLTEEMITQLGRLHPQRLSVIARTSSMRYKRRDLPMDQIARELGVDYVMEGSARREGNRVRISASLIQVRDQTQRWSESFEREMANVLALQSDVARGVARALAITLLPADQSRLAAARPVNPEAYEAYLKGRFQWQTMTPQALDAAMGYFELAVQKDPNYAAPYTGMGTIWGLRCNNGVMRCREAVTKWKEVVRKAKELEPDLPQVQAQAAAIAYYVDWDWPAADREFRRALEVDAADPDVHMWYADYLMNVAGRVDHAIAEARRAVELDPQNTFYQVRVAVAFMDAHREDDAIAVLQQVLKADPGMRQAQINLVQAFAAKRMYTEALAVMTQMNANDPAIVEAQQRAYADGGFPRVARLRPDNLVRQSQTTYVSPGGIAAAYARAGEVALALDYLEKAFEEQETMMVSLGSGRAWDTLRGEPRFSAMLRRMKLD
jgi:serine/threonine protein kinase/tetratricopeptide (TPR) repeat protein